MWKVFFAGLPDILENSFARLTKNLNNFDELVKNPTHHHLFVTINTTIIFWKTKAKCHIYFTLIVISPSEKNVYFFFLWAFLEHPFEVLSIFSVDFFSKHPRVFSYFVYPDIRMCKKLCFLYSLLSSLSYLSTAVLQIKQTKKNIDMLNHLKTYLNLRHVMYSSHILLIWLFRVF